MNSRRQREGSILLSFSLFLWSYSRKICLNMCHGNSDGCTLKLQSKYTKMLGSYLCLSFSRSLLLVFHIFVCDFSRVFLTDKCIENVKSGSIRSSSACNAVNFFSRILRREALSPIYTAETFWRGSDESCTRTKKIVMITHLHVIFSTVLNDVKLWFGTGKRLNISASVLDSCLVRMLLPLQKHGGQKVLRIPIAACSLRTMNKWVVIELLVWLLNTKKYLPLICS